MLLICYNRDPCPNTKVVRNLCTLLCCDASYTPRVEPEVTVDTSNETKALSDQIPTCDAFNGILLLAAQNKVH